jgi:hypothetical protein
MSSSGTDWIVEFSVLVVGALIGVAGKILSDRFNEPKLEVAAETSFIDNQAFKLSGTLFPESSPNPVYVTLRAYRVRITNKQKGFFNAPARNCVAWIDVEGQKEPYQVCWVGSNTQVTINVGDSREVDVYAIAQGYGIVVAPREGGYESGARFLTLGKGHTVKGTIRISSENARLVKKDFTITVSEDQMSLESTLTEPKTRPSE